MAPALRSLLLGAVAFWPSIVMASQNATYSQADQLRAQLALMGDRPDGCPPCFNCLLPAHTCAQYAGCNEFNGKCDCPEGFGGDDCLEPLCGSLPKGKDRPMRSGSTCKCDEGWTGINCNVCTDNKACNALMEKGEGGVCYQNGEVVNHNYQICDVTNQKITSLLGKQRPEVTFTCTQEDQTCDFQFWVDAVESFYCHLSECDSTADWQETKNTTSYKCNKISCSCIPDRMLCGKDGSIDLTDFLDQSIQGPGRFECTQKHGGTHDCAFKEPEMDALILALIGDSSIFLDCHAGECLYETEVPGWKRPVKQINTPLIAGVIAGCSLFLVAVIILTWYLSRRKLNYGAIRLEDSDDESTKLMADHKPASLYFDDVAYSLNGKQILTGIRGICKPGEVTAIMGASGAGKTTFLDILARKNKRGQVNGNFYVNGEKVNDNDYKNVVGFVDQEDTMLPTLTVHETILTSALLRLPRDMGRAAKEQRVLEVEKELGIHHIRDSLIGSEEGKGRGISGGEKRLDEKEKKLHAPMSDRSGLKIDGDAIWITNEKGFSFDRDEDDADRGEGEEMIVGLQAERKLLGQMEGGVQLFKGGEKVETVPEEEDTGRKTQRKARFAQQEDADDQYDDGEGLASDDDEADSDAEVEFNEGKLGKMFRKDADKDLGDDDLAFADSDSDLGALSGEDEVDDDEEYDSDEEAAALRWKDNLNGTAMKLHGKRRSYHTSDLARFMYDDSLSPEDALKRWKGDEDESEEENIEDDEDDDDFFKKSKQEKEDAVEDRSIPAYDYEDLAAKWASEKNVEALRRKFTSTALAAGDDEDDEGSEFEGLDDEDDEGDGEFEDLEADGDEKPAQPAQPTPDDIEAEREKNAKRKEELKMRFEEEDREGFLNDKANARRDGGDIQEFGEDDWYEAQKAMIQKQLDINKEEFENLDERQRSVVEGYRAGKYAKVVLEGVPAEFVKLFDARRPIVVGGLSATEDRFGYLQVRIKRHRWHKRILKTNDPLIFSLGWRRFQTMPIYSTTDSRTRNRMLKYTPEHMHCFATVYGPLIAPNTGFVCFNSMSSSMPGFRIAATGTILSVDESTEIVKKLKLTGTPAKIYKNTAFIKDMFNSSLEIAKFEGASIKTVSGIRGQIKRALSKPEGQFRATFEDKILLSDIVFLRAWYPIKPHRFYNPVTNLIGWQPMRLTGEVRRDQNVPTPQPKNSQYRTIERETRHFNPLRVPRALAAELPFKSQIVETRKQKNDTYMKKRAVVMAPGSEEKKARALMQQLLTIRNDAAAKRRAAKDKNRAAFQKKLAENEEKKEAREKKESKDFWRKNGRKRASAEEGGGGKRRK